MTAIQPVKDDVDEEEEEKKCNDTLEVKTCFCSPSLSLNRQRVFVRFSFQ